MSEQTSPRYLFLELLAVLGLFVFSIPVIMLLSPGGGGTPPLGDPGYLARATFSDLCACLLMATLILLRGQKLDAAGLHPRATPLLQELAIGAALFVGFVGFAWFSGWLRSFPSAWQTFLKSLPLGVQALFFLHITTNALYQELLFRGYLISRLEFLGSRGTAVVASAIIFTLFHWGQPTQVLLFMFACGLAFGALFLWRRNLIKLVIAHALYNLFTFISMGIKPH